MGIYVSHGQPQKENDAVFCFLSKWNALNKNNNQLNK